MGISDFAVMEKRINAASLGTLGSGSLEFIRDTLQKNWDDASAFDDPLVAMLYIYKKQVQEGMTDPQMEHFLLGAGARLVGPHTGEATHAKAARKAILPLHGRATLAPDTVGYPPLLQRVESVVLKSLRALESAQAKQKRVLERFGQAGLMLAHERELHAIREELTIALMRAAAETTAGKVQNIGLMRERASEIKEQMLEVIRRTAEGQRHRLSLLKKGQRPSDPIRIETDFSLLAEGVAEEKVRDGTEGLAVSAVSSPISDTFVDAYSILARYFPADELDTPKLLADYHLQTSTGHIEETAGKRTYNRYALVIIRDETGEYTGKQGTIIAAADGTFSGTEIVNEFYLSHIAVLPRFRRTQIATLLETAVLTLAEEYAMDAERRLGVSYRPGRTGKKLMAMVLETEFPSLRPSEMGLTLGRLLFHGINGFSIIPASHLRYRQSDTTWEEGAPYNAKKWKSVPLYFAIRGIDRPLSGALAQGLLRLMYDGFMSSGMCAEGVEADWEYAISAMSREAAPVPLPRTVEELRRFIEQQGDSVSVLGTHYADSPWAREYLESSERPMSLDEAIARFSRGDRQPPHGI